MVTKKEIISRIRRGKKVTQAEANKIQVMDYIKAKVYYRGLQKRKKTLRRK